MAWKPVLEGGMRDRAVELIKDIGAALDDPATPGLERGGASLASGVAGMAVFSAYQEQAGLGGGERADRFLTQAVDAVAEQPLTSSLYSGFSGIAWTAEHITGGGEGDEEDANEEIDGALLEHLSMTPWNLDYDLIVGLVGYGVYGVERAGRPGGRACLTRTIDRLSDTAVEVEGMPGVTWWTGPHLMIPQTREINPKGNYNAGLAHGVPGVVALLGEAIAAGVDVERSRALLDRAMTWLLSTRDEGVDGSQFPYTIDIPPQHEPKRVRAAWCYGDPGVAAAIMLAGQGAGVAAWQETAVEVARAAAQRAPDTCGVVDGGLCHGAAGLAHIYNRFHQATGEAVFADAARLWTERLFAMHKPGEGVAGFLSWSPIKDDKLGWEPDAGLLTGAAGIGLALLGLATEFEPKWDRMLLTNVRPA